MKDSSPDKQLTYSVIIRTLSGGAKYQRLLDSIASQSIPPEHVYVVLPHGYPAPKEQMGTEEFLFTEKGMWNQRIFGLDYLWKNDIPSEFLIVCDDDIEFGPAFADRIMTLAKDNKADIVCPLEEVSCRPISRMIYAMIGNRFESAKSRFKISVTSGGGHIVNNALADNVNPTQSGIFQCFLIRNDAVTRLNLSEENWLDRTPYALFDDQVLFYKAYCYGMNVVSCKEPAFTHLDAKSRVSKRVRARDTAYSMASNSMIFWHRFIYLNSSFPKPDTAKIAAISRKLLMNFFFYTTRGLLRGDFKMMTSYIAGALSGMKFIRSSEYKAIPTVDRSSRTHKTRMNRP
ncbi:MAG: hypothetical protein K2L49_01005 [Muribaculaceae bacterium]|nr:hypothetical protein [Muribaculaceae bacterium]